MINYEKLGLSFNPISTREVTEEIQTIFSIEIVAYDEKYLELPSIVSKKKQEIFGGIKDRVWKKL